MALMLIKKPTKKYFFVGAKTDSIHPVWPHSLVKPLIKQLKLFES
jgi:hypothetical protein